MVSKERFCTNPTTAFKDYAHNAGITDDNSEFAEMTTKYNKSLLIVYYSRIHYTITMLKCYYHCIENYFYL